MHFKDANAERSAATRQRLLDAAAHVFAEDGFRSGWDASDLPSDRQLRTADS